MKIGIIDADLVGRNRHSFPNLASMKISGCHKKNNDIVDMITDYNEIQNYDKVYISKVFNDTPVPQKVLKSSFVEYGGTGFYYDKAPPLPYDVEHSMPDYHLYDEYIYSQIAKGVKRSHFKYYLDYSIGFTTRGCIRQCDFCVNKNYRSCTLHSPLEEFLDINRPYICLLDDNILACKDWKSVFDSLISSKKRFQYKQGIDERLLDDEKCRYIFQNSKWIGRKIFAFDNIKDKNVIIEKLELIRKYTNEEMTFYVLCGYDRSGVYDENFWKNDISNMFERISILAKYRCLPYIMRHNNYMKSQYKGIYINAAAWCNQPNCFKKITFADFSKMRGMKNGRSSSDFERYVSEGGKKGASWLYYEKFANIYPDIAEKYFNFKGGGYNGC